MGAGNVGVTSIRTLVAAKVAEMEPDEITAMHLSLVQGGDPREALGGEKLEGLFPKGLHQTTLDILEEVLAANIQENLSPEAIELIELLKSAD